MEIYFTLHRLRNFFTESTNLIVGSRVLHYKCLEIQILPKPLWTWWKQFIIESSLNIYIFQSISVNRIPCRLLVYAHQASLKYTCSINQMYDQIQLWKFQQDWSLRFWKQKWTCIERFCINSGHGICVNYISNFILPHKVKNIRMFSTIMSTLHCVTCFLSIYTFIYS